MPKKILLADDSITIQKVVELTFSDGDYEVTAVNNGAKAVQKLSEMRPDIILSDIIMPEKNGYEVCEYVKSHPDFRNIPVVLLTGTFEPFDPDRAEKAGCDAVVTKPFESQSLIQRVEELIAQSASAAPAAVEPEPEAEAVSPWMEEPAPAAGPASSSLATGVFSPPAPESFTHEQDIFSAPPAPEAPMEMPFETPAEAPLGTEPPADAFSGETRAFPRMSFDDLQQPAATEPPPPPPAEAPAWSLDAPASEESAWGSEEPAAPVSESFEAPQASTPPFEQPAEDDGSTRAFPKMTFEDLQAAAPAEQPEMPAWNASEPQAFTEEAPAFGGETRAFPKMSFDDFQQQPAAEPEAPAGEGEAPAFETPSFEGESQPAAFGAEATTPLDTESPAFSAETSAFPKMSFDDFQQPAAPAEPEVPTSTEPEATAAEPMPWEEEPAPAPEFWSPAAERTDYEAPAAESEAEAFAAAEPEAPAFESTIEEEPAEEPPASAFAETAEPAWAPEEMPAEPVAAAEAEPEPQPEWGVAAGAAAEAEAAAEPAEPVVPSTALAPAIIAAADGADLTDEQIDRIARRVVELMSEKVVRNIAWEVIPDMAEMVVKERIRQLEAEA